MKRIKIGLLPLFIKLYDDDPGLAASRGALEPYCDEIAEKLAARGPEVIRVPFCRLKAEFAAAVERFEREGADCIVTLHMAYSPSLEAIDALAATKLPVVVCDSTTCWDFSPAQSAERIMHCHGVHGVMDLCAMLVRRGKPFAIAAGHADHSDVLDRVCGFVRAARAANTLRGSAVGTVGGSFDGMGDFFIAPDELERRLGVRVVRATPEELKELGKGVSEDALRAEYDALCARAEGMKELGFDACRSTVFSDLVIRRWIKAHRLGAYTVNFLAVGESAGLPAMPFIESCLQMEKGVGYAGEGDILTAAMTGALLRGFGADRASFAEIFCPDWKGNTLLLSHMGEMNFALTQKKPFAHRPPFPFRADAEDAVIASAAYRGGEALYLNLCRDENDRFRLVIAPVEMLDRDSAAYRTEIRGWMKPKMPVGAFLEKLSQNGATHHSALLYGAKAEQAAFFARLIGAEPVVLE